MHVKAKGTRPGTVRRLCITLICKFPHSKLANWRHDPALLPGTSKNNEQYLRAHHYEAGGK